MNVTKLDLKQANARQKHLAFMEYCWQRKKGMKIGVHTSAICKKIDTAIANFKKGISTYLIVLVCFRQGKSEIVSRFLPAHFLGEFPDLEVIVASHNQRMLTKFSRFGRTLIRSKKFDELYPKVKISKEKSGIEEWGIEGTQGLAQYFGIHAGSAGTGGSMVIIDDYFGKREDAESEVMREKTWDSFTDNIFSRTADPCIFLFTVTPWHVDDLVGRIQQNMVDDPEYPKFEVIKFPAYSDDYKEGTLFPEMYSRTWYDTHKKLLGTYGFVSLMQCDPQIKSGNMLKIDKIQYYNKGEEPDGLTWVRAWDLASTKKQLQKSDPDYTVGIKLAVQKIPTNIPGETMPIIWIEDMTRGQWEVTIRNRIIRDTALADRHIAVGIEAIAAYKDAYNEISEVLSGIRSIRPLQLRGDKISKASMLVPSFEAGNVYLCRGSWNGDCIAEIGEFPGGKHDDIVDAIVCAYYMCQYMDIQFYTYNDFQNKIEHQNEIVEITLCRIDGLQRISCTIEEYMKYIRQLLLDKKKEQNGGKVGIFIGNEIRRLDLELGYDKVAR